MRPALHLLVCCALSVSSACTPSAAGTDASPPDAGRLATDASDAAPVRTATVDASSPDDVVLPPSSSDELTARMRHLLEAIAHDSPDLAMDALFPRDAFLASKDATDAARIWDGKFVAAFRKHVHALNKRTKGADKATFVSFEIGHAVVQLTPKKRDFKRPLWRVRHSKLTFTVDGKTQRVEIGEMTSWRGAWYITRLR